MCIIKKIFIFITLFGLLQQDVKCLGINLAQTQILVTDDVYRISLRPWGKNPPFTLYYHLFPSQWRQTDKYILVPKIKSQIWKQYLVSVVLRDRLNNQFRISVMFLLNSKTLIMDTTAYDFFTSSTSLGLDAINPSNFIKLIEQESNIKPTREALESGKTKQTINLRFQDVFTNIIDPPIIKKLLSQGHLPAVIKQIFDIQRKSLSCIQNLAYYKQIAALANQVIIEKLKKLQQFETQFVNKKGKDFAEEQAVISKKITLEELKQLQQKQIKKKKEYYSITQQYMQRLKTFENVRQQVKSAEESLIQIQSKRDKILQRIQKQQENRFKLQLVNPKGNSSNPRINARVNSAIKGLNILKRQLDNLSNKIDQMSKNQQILVNYVNQLEKQNLDLQIAIDRLQQQLSKINVDLYTNLANQPPPQQIPPIISNFLQVQPQMLPIQKKSPISPLPIPSQLTSLSPQVEEYFKTMPIGYKIIAKNRYYLNLRIVGQLSSVADAHRQLMAIQLIKRYLDGFIDKEYYECYGVGNFMSARDEEGLYIYRVPYSQFITYLNKFYLNNTNNKLLMTKNALPMQKIQLRRADILPTTVTKTLYDIFKKQIQSEKKIRQVRDRLSCMSSEPLQSFVGLIKSIKDNVFQVKLPPLQTYYVIKGACTRLEVSGEQMPEKLLFWRGIKISDNIYNAYFILIM